MSYLLLSRTPFWFWWI